MRSWNIRTPLLYAIKKNTGTFRRIAGLLRTAGLPEKNRPEAVRRNERKLMVCRALLTEPEILLLDEPTAGMDALAADRCGTF